MIKKPLQWKSQQQTVLMLRFPDAKESVMKCCSSMVIGGIDAYIYHTSDEFSKASSRTGTCMYTHGIIPVTLFMSLKL
jgi:hypothetical protein